VSLPSKKVDLLIVPVVVKVLPRQQSGGRCGKARFKLLTTQRATTHRGAVGIEPGGLKNQESRESSLIHAHCGPDLLRNLYAISAANRISMNYMLHLHSRILRGCLPLWEQSELATGAWRSVRAVGARE
jgi:hypothetical protein